MMANIPLQHLRTGSVASSFRSMHMDTRMLLHSKIRYTHTLQTLGYAHTLLTLDYTINSSEKCLTTRR